jgi:hypothetical protein
MASSRRPKTTMSIMAWKSIKLTPSEIDMLDDVFSAIPEDPRECQELGIPTTGGDVIVSYSDIELNLNEPNTPSRRSYLEYLPITLKDYAADKLGLCDPLVSVERGEAARYQKAALRLAAKLEEVLKNHPLPTTVATPEAAETQPLVRTTQGAATAPAKTNPKTLIQEAEKFLADHCVLPDPRFTLPLVLWAAHTHAWELASFNAVPYLNFVGTRNSGKNHTIHALGSMCHNFMFIAKATEAALRDIVDASEPTLGTAECEDDLQKHNSYIHRLFNSGYVPNEPFVKIDHGQPRQFQIYCPKMVATIGNVEESLHSRCMVIMMQLHTPVMTGDNFQQGRQLGKQLQLAVLQLMEEITEVYHSDTLKRPELLEARDWQTFKALFAMCKVLAPERMEEFTRCATYIAAIKTRPPQSIRAMHALEADATFATNSRRLLKDAAQVVSNYPTKNIASEELITRLLALPHGWWEGFGTKNSDGRLLTLADGQRGLQLLARMLALATDGMLAPSKTPIYIRKGKTAHGYVVSEIQDAVSGRVRLVAEDETPLLPPTIPQRVTIVKGEK